MSTSKFLKNIFNVFDGGVSSRRVSNPSLSQQVVQKMLHRNKNAFRTPYPKFARYETYMPMDISPDQTVAVAKNRRSRKSKNSNKSKSSKTKKTTKVVQSADDELADMISNINMSADRNKHLSNVGKKLLAQAAKIAREEKKRELLAGPARRSSRNRSQPQRFTPGPGK